MIQYQTLKTNITRTVWQTVRRITDEILGVKGLTSILNLSVISGEGSASFIDKSQIQVKQTRAILDYFDFHWVTVDPFRTRETVCGHSLTHP